MYQKVLLAAAFALLSSNLANAQGPNHRPFGLGLTLGDPAGISAKYWFDRKNALDVALGYGFFPYYNGVAVYSDYLYNVLTLMPAKRVSFELLFYMGIGGKLGFWRYHRDGRDESGLGLGVRVPFGITMVFPRAPFDVFFEIAPCLSFVTPDPFWFDFDVAIGGRFYF